MTRTPFDAFVHALAPVYGAVEARSMARIVFEDLFHVRHDRTRDLGAEERKLLDDIRNRLLAGEPLQYVLGQADFFGMKLEVNPAVLIPRQETEELVAWALEWLGQRHLSTPRVLDIGTGSGCIAIAVARKMPAATVSAVDVSEAALELAARNAEHQGVPVRFGRMDILQKSQWPDASYDLILSNPPYISPEETMHMPAHVLEHEPHLALFASAADPLEFYKAIAAFARQKLNPDGALLVEINEFRSAPVKIIFEQAGFRDIAIRRDISGAERMVGAGLSTFRRG